MKLLRPIVTLDLETTGIWVEKDKIIEVGMVRLTPEGKKQTYVKRVNPGMPIPKNATLIHNITDDDVRDAPAFKDIAQEVLEFIGDSDLGGFSILRFDLPLLERELSEAGLIFRWGEREIYDAQKIYHIHEKRDLTAAYSLYCAKDLKDVHSSLGDAEATIEILEAQVKRYGSPEAGLESLKDFDYERSSAYFDKERKFSWWNGELYPAFGKYRMKKHIKDILKSDRPYLKWILTKDFSEEIKTMVGNVLEGEFPKVPEDL